MDLQSLIRDVPDFPKPGVNFKDITPLLKDPLAFRTVIDRLAEVSMPRGTEAVVAIESRGFLFGAPLACSLGVPFVPLRKAGKLPAERVSVDYYLEYGSGQLDMHQDALQHGQKVVIVDDLLATGGTAVAAAELVESVGAVVGHFSFVVELEFLGGRQRLSGYEVSTLLCFP